MFPCRHGHEINVIVACYCRHRLSGIRIHDTVDYKAIDEVAAYQHCKGYDK